MKALDVFDPAAVKVQTLKSAVDAACYLLRVDDIVSGISKKKPQGGGGGPAPQEGPDESAAELE